MAIQLIMEHYAILSMLQCTTLIFGILNTASVLLILVSETFVIDGFM